MSRRARLVVPKVPLHIIQRGNNRQACFFDEEDYQRYLSWLKEYAEQTGCAVHSYVLMTNHVHLLITPDSSSSPGQLMKLLGQRYVQYINRCYKRSGTLWEGRFRSSLVEEESYLMACTRYIELNPVRAGMVEHPADYRWSSYLANAQGESNTVITPHDLYLALGRGKISRSKAYRKLFLSELDPKLMDEIRAATNGNYALGHQKFHEEIAAMLKRRVTPGKAGRPVKERGG